MYLIPTSSVSSNGVTPRKVSKFNLDNGFAVLLNLVNLSNLPYASQLAGVLGLIYNKITNDFVIDPVALIGDLKLARAWYIKAIRGGDRANIGMRPTRWDTVSECPSLLSGVMEVVDAVMANAEFHETVFFHRVIFAILSLDRVIVVPASPNYASITNEFKYLNNTTKDDAVTLSEVQAALNALNITPEAFREAYEHHAAMFKYEVLSSMGPNGQSTWSAHSDVRAWAKEPELFKQFNTYIQESGLGFMLDDMEGTMRLYESDIEPQRFPYLGKLSVIEEWGGKARIVAALDYWTQMALTPLHNTVNEFLKELPMDGSFNQDAVASRVKEWTKTEGLSVNCYDLTAATDRIPISLQATVVGHLMSSTSFGHAWASILKDRKYLCGDANTRKYSVGQPMGARSSFPMLALIHHVIIQVAASRAKVGEYTSYAIVGDDCALTDNSVSAKYKVITAACGVAINLSKSIEDAAGCLPAAELCKRTFISGHEISSIPIKQLCKTLRDGRLAPQLQNELVRRNIGLEAKSFWQLMATILDKESLGLLIKDNVMPNEVNGLSSNISVPVPRMDDPANWFGGVKLTKDDVVQVYTWTVASESLKRLDALLRQSMAISKLISLRSGENDPAFPQTLMGELKGVIKAAATAAAPDAAAALEELPRLNSFHPIVQASDSEARRLADDLFLLASADIVMTKRARSGLLDRFRNSLTDIWTGRNLVSPSQDRSLLTKTLRNLENIVLKKTDHKLDYTVVLSQVNRSWSVSLVLGEKVQVNAVKARVTTSMAAADAALGEVIQNFTFSANMTSNPSDLVANKDLPRKTSRTAAKRTAES